LENIKLEEALSFLKDKIMQLNVCIFGVSGYTGANLLYYLLKHPNVNVVGVFGNSSIGRNLNELFPNYHNVPNIDISDYKSFDFDNVNLIFSCLPHGSFQKNIINNINTSISIIDLSGDFRLKDLEEYKSFYGEAHIAQSYAKNFVYGLSEIYRDEIKKSKFIANPGCYPTSILLPLIPLLKKGLINNQHLVIDSKSGVSGAGKKLEKQYLYSEVNENFLSYGIKKHKHYAEINQELLKFGKNSFTFVPHLVPVTQGLQSTIYLDKENELSIYKKTLQDFFKQDSFVKIYKDDVPSFSDVIKTNNIAINIFEDYSKKKIIIVSCIDNLIKGAAGQAIQNMNIMFGFTESESLI